MSTSSVDVVRNYLSAAWADPASTISAASREFLAEDFQSVDEDGNVQMDKAAYIGMGELMLGAFDDFRWTVDELAEEGDDGVVMTGHFEGTHARDLDLSAMGFGVIPASGKRIVWPTASSLWTVQDGKLVREQPRGGGAGVAAFFAALGVELPSG